MIFSRLKNRLERFRKPFLGLVKRLVFRGEKPMQQMEERYTREAAYSLKENLKVATTDTNDLTIRRIDEIVQARRTALDARLAPMINLAEGNDALSTQFRSLKQRINNSLNAVRAQFGEYLQRSNITNQATAIIQRHHQPLQDIADQFFNRASATEQASVQAAIAAARVTPPVQPPVVNQPQQKPQVRPVLRPAELASGPLPQPKRRSEEAPQVPERRDTPRGRYEINRAFKDAQALRFHEMSRAWAREGASWINDGGPQVNDGISRFADDFRSMIIRDFNNPDSQYNGHRGIDAGYAFIQDLMGGAEANSTHNQMRTIIQRAYRIFEAYGRRKRDTNPRFRRQFEVNRRAAYLELRTDFFKGLTVDFDGLIESTNDDIQRLINAAPPLVLEELRNPEAPVRRVQREIERTVRRTLRMSENPEPTKPPPHPEEAPETVPRFNEQFQRLRARGISAARFRNFLSRYQTDEHITAQLTTVLSIPNGQEVYLDRFDEGLSAHFEVDMFREHRILPNAWTMLPQIYNTIRTNHSSGLITHESFTQALRNNAVANQYPRLYMNAEHVMVYMHQARGTNTPLGLSRLQSNYLNSSLNGLKEVLDSVNTGTENQTTVFELRNTLYLDQELSFKQNLEFFHLSSNKRVDSNGQALRPYDISWNSADTDGEVPPWKAMVITQLQAYHISLNSVADDVKVEDVLAHAANFVALVESQDFTEQGSPSPNTLQYNISGINMSFDRSSANALQVRQYLTRVISHGEFENPQKKVDFAMHLHERFSATNLNFSPDIILELLEDGVKPLRLTGSGRVEPVTATSLEVFDDYLSIVQNVSGQYVVRYRGAERVDVAIDQTLAAAYFHDMRERGENTPA